MKAVEFTAKSMEISHAMRRTIEDTEKDYMVIKAYPLSQKALLFNQRHKEREIPITFVCFLESLLCLFEIGDVYDFHGEVTFNWGGTYLTITKIYDNTGKRILRKKNTKEKGNHQESIEETP